MNGKPHGRQTWFNPLCAPGCTTLFPKPQKDEGAAGTSCSRKNQTGNQIFAVGLRFWTLPPASCWILSMLLIILILLLVFGGGGGYYAYGPSGGIGIGGIVLIVLVV